MAENQDCLKAFEKEPIRTLDPERLFRIRYDRAVACADSLEYIAYKILPYNLLKSFTIVFDPTWKFRLSPYKITPANRVREMRSNNIFLNNRSWSSTQRGTTQTTSLLCHNCTFAHSVTKSDDDDFTASFPQDPLEVTLRDTTRKTRPIGSDYGECEFFTYSLNSPSRTVQRTGRTHVTTRCSLGADFGACPGKETNQRQDFSYVMRTLGSSAIYSAGNIALLKVNALTELTNVMSSNIDKMLGAALPNSRRLTLFRSAFELRELPRAAANLQQTLQLFARDLRSVPKGIRELIYSAKSHKAIPKEYLSFWFGWRQIYNDVLNLLEKPAKVGKEVNYLLERRGKPTTFRRQLKLPGSGMTAPSWLYDPSAMTNNSVNDEIFVSTGTRHENHHELRLVLNATFDFPAIGIPALRQQLVHEKLGVSPTASDLYNLIPWTWLFDWFSGIGNYVELIDTINRADDLYNWGFLTGVTHGNVVTQHNTKISSVSSYRYAHMTTTESVTSTSNMNHSSVLGYKAHIRKDICTAYGVKSTVNTSSLTAYQQSIIGAILLSFR